MANPTWFSTTPVHLDADTPAQACRALPGLSFQFGWSPLQMPFLPLSSAPCLPCLPSPSNSTRICSSTARFPSPETGVPRVQCFSIKLGLWCYPYHVVLWEWNECQVFNAEPTAHSSSSNVIYFYYFFSPWSLNIRSFPQIILPSFETYLCLFGIMCLFIVLQYL